MAKPDDQLSEQIIGACIEVHRCLGPGLLESAYEECLCHELNLRGIVFRRQVSKSLVYKGIALDANYRLDLVVGDRIVVEIKATESISPIHVTHSIEIRRPPSNPQETPSDLPGSPAPC